VRYGSKQRHTKRLRLRRHRFAVLDQQELPFPLRRSQKQRRTR
jgi:hypothetical protein